MNLCEECKQVIVPFDDDGYLVGPDDGVRFKYWHKRCYKTTTTPSRGPLPET